MPKAVRRRSGPKSVTERAEPYPAPKPVEAEASTKSVSPAPKTTKSQNAASKTASEVTADKPASFREVVLENPDEIYDTCSVLRTKINTFLGKDNGKPENAIPGEFKKNGDPKPYTKKQFCEECGASTRALDTFLKAKKIMGGAESAIYPGAYRFFEKKRIFEGKPKSVARKKTEEEFRGGLELIDPNHVRLWVGPNTNPASLLNKYGQ